MLSIHAFCTSKHYTSDGHKFQEYAARRALVLQVTGIIRVRSDRVYCTAQRIELRHQVIDIVDPIFIDDFLMLRKHPLQKAAHSAFGTIIGAFQL